MSSDFGRALRVLPLALLGACSWFTDFRDQPKYEPWESVNDSTPFRANPQFSVPMNGSPAPGLMVSYRPLIPVIDSVAAVVGPNPVAADARSLENGRKSFQINCSVCHGPAGRGDGPAVRYGVLPIPLIGASTQGLSDGQIFGIIRNGRGNMPTYNRIPDMERWDVINYLRGLQGRHQVVTAPAGLPGETGATLPSATELAPTRPAPYYHRIGSQAGIPLGADGAAPAPGAATPGASTPAGAATDSAAAIAPTTGPAAARDTAAARPQPAPARPAAPTDTNTRGSQP